MPHAHLLMWDQREMKLLFSFIRNILGSFSSADETRPSHIMPPHLLIRLRCLKTQQLYSHVEKKKDLPSPSDSSSISNNLHTHSYNSAPHAQHLSPHTIRFQHLAHSTLTRPASSSLHTSKTVFAESIQLPNLYHDVKPITIFIQRPSIQWEQQRSHLRRKLRTRRLCQVRLAGISFRSIHHHSRAE